MKGYEVTIPGKPIGQQRHRVANIGGRPRMYDPKASKEWKQFAATIMRNVHGYHGPFEEPCFVRIAAFFDIPKSYTQKQRDYPWRGKKPDIDNIAKAVLDAGNGILWKDDALVVDLTVIKYQQEGLEQVVVTVGNMA